MCCISCRNKCIQWSRPASHDTPAPSSLAPPRPPLLRPPPQASIAASSSLNATRNRRNRCSTSWCRNRERWMLLYVRRTPVGRSTPTGHGTSTTGDTKERAAGEYSSPYVPKADGTGQCKPPVSAPVKLPPKIPPQVGSTSYRNLSGASGNESSPVVEADSANAASRFED